VEEPNVRDIDYFDFLRELRLLWRYYFPLAGSICEGVSATESGYQTLALLVGLIASSIISGQIVARTGRYKLLILVALTTIAVGLFLMTNLHANTSLPNLWVWMFITGIGIGPTMAIYTIVIQNAVR
jgi:MFS family permease